MERDDRLLRADDVAEMLGIARSTVFDWNRQGKLPCVVLNRGNFRAVRRWRLGDVQRFVERGAGG